MISGNLSACPVEVKTDPMNGTVAALLDVDVLSQGTYHRFLSVPVGSGPSASLDTHICCCGDENARRVQRL